MRLLNHKLLTLLLLLVCLLQGSWLALQYQDTATPSPNVVNSVTTAPLPEATPTRRPPSLQQANAFEEITTRTLFAEDRQYVEEKPVVKQEKPKPKPPARNPGFELTGVYISAQEKIALIKTRNREKPEPVHLDEAFEGWVLYALDTATAKLESDGQKITLTMEQEDKGKKGKHRPQTLSNGLPDEVMLMPEFEPEPL